MKTLRKTAEDNAKSKQGRAAVDDVRVCSEIQDYKSRMDRCRSPTPDRANGKERYAEFLGYMREAFVSVTVPLIVGTFTYLTLNAIIHALLR